ncbi:MAG: hypothetical protein C4547_13630 [Phycisphaerales bacterium]|nr:MAG: hypothetical protein C4547_13630 [Phycisphaerales bacterium]
MKSSDVLRVLMAVLLALVPCYAPATAVAGTIFNWTGEADATDPNPNDWENLDNWDNTAAYPGQSSATDEAVINDPVPKALVIQDVQNLVVARLFLGHQHVLQLDEPLEVTTGVTDLGEARFEGNVEIKGDSALEAQWVWVNSKDMDTAIAVNGTASLITTGG